MRSDRELSVVPVSVDTFYAKVAAAAVEAGASIVNDVSGGTMDPDMHKEVGKAGAPCSMLACTVLPACCAAACAAYQLHCLALHCLALLVTITTMPPWD
jgi:dihydropteroate synthase